MHYHNVHLIYWYENTLKLLSSYRWRLVCHQHHSHYYILYTLHGGVWNHFSLIITFFQLGAHIVHFLLKHLKSKSFLTHTNIISKEKTKLINYARMPFFPLCHGTRFNKEKEFKICHISPVCIPFAMRIHTTSSVHWNANVILVCELFKQANPISNSALVKMEMQPTKTLPWMQFS